MIKTTIFGGILFLLPFGILLLVLSELLILANMLVQPLATVFPKEDYLGVSLAAVLAVVLILVVCFAAGFATRYALLSGFSAKTEKFLSDAIPGYWMIRTRLSSAVNSNVPEQGYPVVTLKVGGLKRYAFMIEDHGDTIDAVVFLPGAPNAEKGIICRVPRSDLKIEDLSADKIHTSFQFYGRGLVETEQKTVKETAN